MRKLSPHLSIYKFPITAISSIFNRISGIYIAGVVGSGIVIHSLDNNVKDNIYKKYYELNKITSKTLNFTVVYPFVYHTFGAIRHLIWDFNPKLLTNNSVKNSSRFILIGSIVPTILIDDKFLEKFIKYS